MRPNAPIPTANQPSNHRICSTISDCSCHLLLDITNRPNHKKPNIREKNVRLFGEKILIFIKILSKAVGMKCHCGYKSITRSILAMLCFKHINDY